MFIAVESTAYSNIHDRMPMSKLLDLVLQILEFLPFLVFTCDIASLPGPKPNSVTGAAANAYRDCKFGYFPLKTKYM